MSICSDRVKRAESLVADFEGLTLAQVKSVKSNRKAEKFLDEYFKAKCLTDFWTHVSQLVYRENMHHYYTPLHGTEGMAGFLQDWTKTENGITVPVQEKFMVVAREHCKSQLVMAYVPWRFARDTSERIQYRSHKDEMSEAVLDGTVGIMEMPEYQRAYPWVEPAGGWSTPGKNGSKKRLMIAREIKGQRTASLMRFGFNSQNIGEHFTFAWYDDWETEDTATSDDLRPLLESKYAADDNVMLAGSGRLTTGTPWWIDAYIHLAIQGKAQFKDRDYDLFIQSAFVKMFDEPFLIREGEIELLDEDRKTFRCKGAGFPTVDGTLYLHQARVLFYSPAAKDFVTEVREVIWNNGDHFRVNRPFPEFLGQPRSCEIGTERPAAPNRFTLDDIDLDPTNQSLQIDLSAPFVDVVQHVRASLPRKSRTQGKTVFMAQMRLEPMNTEDIVFNWDDVKLFSRANLPEGERKWLRTCDIAGPKKTTAHTAMLYGFRHESGYYFTHLYWGDRTVMEILLELCLGHLRIEQFDPGHTLCFTSLERAAREEYLRAIFPRVLKDPEAFFADVPALKQFAKEFEGMYDLNIPMRELPGRGIINKGMRLLGMQPMWNKGEIYIAEEIEYMDEIQNEGVRFRPDITNGFDIFDAMNDFVQLSRNLLRRRIEKKPEQGPGRFALANRLRFQASFAGGISGWSG